MQGFDFQSRRSPIYARHGMVACSQPLATEAGLRILQQGGNAADAAVAVAACLNVTQANSTGIGGDMFCLYWDNAKKTVSGINGSGRCPANLSLESLAQRGFSEQNRPGVYSTLWTTVPGAAAGWVDTVEKFGSGKLTLEQILSPAINLAEEGFPVAPISAQAWAAGYDQLRLGPYGHEMLLDGRAPEAGEILKLPTLAQTFREVAAKGKAGFYEGRIASAIVDVVTQLGGVMTLEDLKNHHSTFEEPINVNYRGVDVFEIPPNGQGITALMALNILKGFDVGNMEYHSVEHLHLLIESLRLAFADTRYYVADQKFETVPVKEMLSEEYAQTRRALIGQRAGHLEHGYPAHKANTVYFCVVDGNDMGFGTGIIPKGCGFTLHNRGENFSLDPSHPNRLQPGKRPYHTIIPGMCVKDGELWCAFGVMGAFMQPQGHVQVISNMLDFGMTPQQALDAPRVQIEGGDANAGRILLENGIDHAKAVALAQRGHKTPVVIHEWTRRLAFGVGQIIRRDKDTGVLCAGSDPRHDGLALGY